MDVTPVLLIILDGFGYREECEDNAICQARKPLCEQCDLLDLCPTGQATLSLATDGVSAPKDKSASGQPRTRTRK